MAGALLAESWSVASLHQARALSSLHGAMRERARRRCKGHACRGFVEYPIREAIRLQEPVLLDSDQVSATRLLDLAGEVAAELCVTATTARTHTTLNRELQRWRGSVVAVLSVVRLAPGFAARVVGGECEVLHCLAIAGRLNRRSLLIPSRPTPEQLSAA